VKQLVNDDRERVRSISRPRLLQPIDTQPHHTAARFRERDGAGRAVRMARVVDEHDHRHIGANVDVHGHEAIGERLSLLIPEIGQDIAAPGLGQQP
jgi:hypothetical protein